MSNVITLLTDYGSRDSYVGQMKGVILSRTKASVQIVDISHEVPPQDIRCGARLLSEAAMCFPPGTVHLAVVDPGVGTQRRIVAAEIGEQRFVAPDNGLLSFLLDLHPLKQSNSVENPRLRAQIPSSTFHGRDILAPAAAYLATGGKISEMGPPAGELQRLRVPPSVNHQGPELVLTVLGVDHFGNILSGACLEDLLRFGVDRPLVLGMRGAWLPLRIVNTYAEAQAGSLVALFNSQDKFEVAVVNGSAGRALGISVGDTLTIRSEINATLKNG